MDTLGIDFFLRANSNNKSIFHVYCRITVNGSPVEMALKGKVTDPDLFDSSNEKFKGSSDEAKAWNNHLKNVRFRLTEAYRDMEDKKVPITAQAVKDAYKGKKDSKNTDRTILTLIKYHNVTNPDRLKEGSLKNYRTTLKYVEKFIPFKYNSEDYPLKDLNYEFILSLENYIRDNPVKVYDKCDVNGLAKHMERVCKIVRFGQKKLKWLATFPFDGYEIHKTRAKQVRISKAEFKILSEAEFSNEGLQLSLDLYTSTCYCGLAYADVMNLGEEHIVNNENGIIWIDTYRIKSDVHEPVPLLAPALRLIEKYRNDPRSISRGKIFPYISNTELNRNLKIIAEIKGVNKELNFHSARRFFGKEMTLKQGVPITTVQKLMGHTKLQTTLGYAETDQEKIEMDMMPLLQKYNGAATSAIITSLNETKQIANYEMSMIYLCLISKRIPVSSDQIDSYSILGIDLLQDDVTTDGKISLVNAVLPGGWTKVLDKKRWELHILDDRKCKRVVISYKPGEYVYAKFLSRFSIEISDNSDVFQNICEALVYDNMDNSDIFCSGLVQRDEFSNSRKEAVKVSEAFLNINYPKWHSLSAYWD